MNREDLMSLLEIICKERNIGFNSPVLPVIKCFSNKLGFDNFITLF